MHQESRAFRRAEIFPRKKSPSKAEAGPEQRQICQKETYIWGKRPTEETYTRDLSKRPINQPIKQTYTRDLQKRPTEETYKIDPQKRIIKATYKRDLQERPNKRTYKKDLQKRPTEGTNRRVQ